MKKKYKNIRGYPINVDGKQIMTSDELEIEVIADNKQELNNLVYHKYIEEVKG